MARVRTCMGCMKPERECECPPDDEPEPLGGDESTAA